MLSVPANIAEGCGKASDLEFRRFLRIAMSSAMEADYHLQMARDSGFLDEQRYEDLSTRLLEVRRMLGGLLKRLNATLDGAISSATPPVP